MAQKGVFGGRVKLGVIIFIFSLSLPCGHCGLVVADEPTENISNPVITREDPVITKNNPADQNNPNLIPEIISEDYEKLKLLTADNNEEVPNTFMKTLKDIFKRYDDMIKTYNIIIKIHKDILNIKENINKKVSSLISNEANVSEIRTLLLTLEKELTTKQEQFLTKQEELDQNQKTFKEIQTDFEINQNKLNENDQRIMEEQKKLGHKQEEISRQQESVTTQLKNVIAKLKEIEEKQIHINPVTESIHLITSEKSYTKENQSERLNQSKIKETKSNLPILAAGMIHEMLKSKFGKDDVSKTFVIKVKNHHKNENENFLGTEFQAENIKGKPFTEVEDLVKKIYSNTSYADDVLEIDQEEIMDTLSYPMSDKVLQFVKVNTNSDLNNRHGFRMKRSLNNNDVTRRSFSKYKRRRHRGVKKYRYPTEKKRVMERTAVKEEKTTLKYEDTDPNTLLAYNYCNQIGQNINKMSLNHCINKFLNRNPSSDMTPPKTKPIHHHVVPSILERSSNNNFLNSSMKRFSYRKQNTESSIQFTDVTTEGQELTTIEVSETTTEKNLTTPMTEDDADREQELSVEIFDTDQRLPTIVIDRKEVPAKSFREVHHVDEGERIDDTEGNIYWDDAVATSNSPGKEREAPENSYSDGEEYAILDADALVLLSKRKEYVEKYNSRILASVMNKHENKKEEKGKEEKKKEDKKKEEKKEDKKKDKVDKKKEKHDRRRKTNIFVNNYR